MNSAMPSSYHAIRREKERKTNINIWMGKRKKHSEWKIVTKRKILRKRSNKYLYSMWDINLTRSVCKNSRYERPQ